MNMGSNPNAEKTYSVAMGQAHTKFGSVFMHIATKKFRITCQ